MAFTIDNKKIAKNTIALYLRTIVTMLISFFTARITLQILGSEDYGLNNLVGGVVSLFSFLNASMGTAVQRFFNIEMGKGNSEKLGKIYGTGLYLHIIVATITFILCELFAVFFLSRMNIPEERMFAAHIVFQVSIISMVLHIINVPNFALLKAHEEFSRIAIIDIIQSVLRLGLLFVLYKISYDKLITYSFFQFGVTLYNVVAIYTYARKYQESRHKICRDRALVKQMLSFISLLVITVLAELGRNQGLVMLINIFFGLAVNAAYAIAHQVLSAVNSFVINIKQPMIPQMMSAYGACDKSTMHKLIFTGTKITSVLLLVLTLPIIFEISQLLNLWLKEPPLYADKLSILILININISSFTYFLYQGVHATGNITKQQLVMSSLYVCNILLIYLAFKLNFNFYSALYVTIGISIVQCVVNTIMSHRYYELNILKFIKQCLMPCICVALITIAVLHIIVLLLPPTLWRLVLVGVTGISLVMLLGYYMVFDQDEKRKMHSLIHLDRLINKE